MLRPTFFITAVLISVLLHANNAVAQPEGIADGEREFVQQLRSRLFFDVAEQFCERQSENCRTADDRALWQLILADCREEHAWTLNEPGRTQILTHAVQSITEFVREQSPMAEFDLLLRVRQIEILSTIALIDATVSEFGPKAAPALLAIKAASEGKQLADGMLLQIEQIRKQIDGNVIRTARDRTRYVVAEFLLVQARQNIADPALRTKAAEATEQLMRSSGDDEMRFRARSLLAESLLDNDDFKGFDLSVTALTSAAVSPTQQTTLAALKIRGLLRRGQPSEALQLTLDLEKQGIRSEQLSTLRLASLLALFELLHRLDATELRQKSSEEFRLLSQRLTPAMQGVWRNCCERINLRFDHVEKFGVEAATAIESVGDLLAAGELAAARQALLEMKLEFVRSRPEIAAVLLMQAGDVAVRLGDWQAAESDLTSAIELFQSTKDHEREAATDLLRVYAIGRNWDTAAGRTDEKADELEADYRAALEHHIATYSESPTIAKAREWRAMLIRATDPVAAAVELLSLADASNDHDPLRLIQAGQILIEAAFRVGTGKPDDADRQASAISRWSRKADEFLSVANDQSAPVTSQNPVEWHRPAIEIQQSVFSLQRRWSAEDNWKKLELDTTTRLRQLPTDGDSNVADTIANSHAIVVLAACRQLLGFEAMKESREVLLTASREKRRQFVTFLLRQTSETENPVPGDPQLGFLALDLLRDDSLEKESIDIQLEQLTAILGASRVANNFELFDSIIGELTKKTLSDIQLQATASLFQRRNTIKADGAASNNTATKFWQSVLGRSKSGDEQWLEASLQLASIAMQERRYSEAAKVLNVIDALHPEWGTPERRFRAADLKKQLESTP